MFALDSCPFCKKAKELLTSKGVSFDVISLTQQPEWRPLMYLLTLFSTRMVLQIKFHIPLDSLLKSASIYNYAVELVISNQLHFPYKSPRHTCPPHKA